MFYPLIFAARAFPVSCRPEYLFAKEAGFFRLECPVIYCLGLFVFAVRPRPYRFRGGDLYRYSIKRILKISHLFFSSFFSIVTSRHKLCSSFTKTFNDSGVPGWKVLSPFTIASYIRVLPMTSSLFTVRS